MPVYPVTINALAKSGANPGIFPNYWHPSSDIPHVDSNNRWWLVANTDVTQATVFAQAWKSTDQGATWNYIGTGPQLKKSFLVNVHVRQDGDLLYVLYVRNSDSTLTIGIFDMLTETWSGSPFTGGPLCYAQQGFLDDGGGRGLLEQMPDGSFIVQYQSQPASGPSTPSHGSLYNRVSYATCSALGVWAAAVALPVTDSGTPLYDYCPNGMVVASATHVDFFVNRYQQGIITFPVAQGVQQLWHVALDAGVLQTLNLVVDDVFPDQEPCISYPVLSGTEIVIIYAGIFNNVWPVSFASLGTKGSVRSVRGVSSNSPTWTSQQINTVQAQGTNPNAFCMATGTTPGVGPGVQVSWNGQNPGGLTFPGFRRSVSSDYGATYGAPQLEFGPTGSDYERNCSGWVGSVGVGVVFIDYDVHQYKLYLFIPIVVQCNNPPDGVVGDAYTHTFTATGGTGVYTWAISSGFLPPGLSLDSGTGGVTGTPTIAGVYPFIVQATDSDGYISNTACSITVTENIMPPTISTTTLLMNPGDVPNTIPGTSNVIETSGSDGTITVALVSGDLPLGTTLASDGTITGFIPPNSGPNGDGTGTFTIYVTATDSNGTTTAVVVITVRRPADCEDTQVAVIDPELVICECPPNSTTIGDIANWAAVGKLKRYDILPDAIDAAVDLYRGVCGKVPFDILRRISPEFRMTAGQAAYSVGCLTPELAGIISVRLSYGNNKFRRMRRSDGRVYDSLGSLVSSIPATYARFGHTLEFNPMPQSSAYTYRLRYWARPTINTTTPANTILLTPKEWDELLKWETLYRMYIHLDMFEKAQQLVAPTSVMANQRQRSVKHTIMFESAIIPRLWNDLLLTISQRENIDEDFSINPLVRNYTRTA